MHGEYVFRVRFRLDPTGEVSVRPATFETTLRRQAAVPGAAGWRFFRDNCWRGEVADHEHACRLAEDVLGVPVESVDFRSLRADPEYHDALRAAIADDLESFNAETVDEAITKYLGSSIDVVDDPEA